jgi:folate-binding protein YgfZ
MIFWQDEVEVTEVGSQVQYGVYGPDAALALSELAGTPIGSTPPGGSVVVAIGGAPVRAWRAGVLEPYAWSLVAGADTAGSLGAALALRLPRLSPAEVETLRIERGLSAWGRELSDQVTPLEAGLADAVSFSKGCYTGQEVLARQANYGKVTRRLVGLRLAQGSSFEPEGTVGAAIETGTGKPGFVGSVAFSPRLGAMIALAVVPREAAEPGNTVVVSVGEHPIVATVEMLPFVPPAAAAGHVQ